MRNILTMDKKLKIKYACDQQWCLMAKLDNSTRHCSLCDKNIVDFSTKQDFDSNKIHCGHFSLGQVNSVQRQLTIKNVGALTLSLLSLLGVTVVPQQIHGQTPVTKTVLTQQKENRIKLSGLVKDKETNEPLPLVYVIANTSDSVLTTTQTDFDGKFTLIIDTSFIKLDQIQMVFSYVGYSQDSIRTVNIPKDLLDKEITISLEALINLPEIEIIEYRLTGLIDIEPTDKKNEPKKK